ncbi:MAG: asparagine--tRNA ligase [Chloroflexota bacterium]|nr:asparagine--tRNA ligase [Chloroflexota bacterium]NOG64147.1 asparagine--tRNA ligase [Chloroflexota bacterium]GIK65798.1 MAG: asparagine--tRNA ligase [Chloroflexota bacterium]
MTVLIENIAGYEGQEVTLKGWLYNKTGKGKLLFLKVRDGSGLIQCVAFQADLSEEVFDIAKRIPQESSLIVTGIVRKDERAPGFPGGYEIGIKNLEIVQMAEDYPITPKEHGVEFLMDNRHLWVRSSRQWAILRIRATVIKAIRDWLDNHGYTLVDTPILSSNAGENSTDLFELDYFGTPAYLAQTGQLYNEANMMSFGKVYAFGPTFRAEKSKTRRHLIEFWMVEPEMAYFSLEDLMAMEEEFVSYIVQTVLETRKLELALIERDTTKLQNVKAPFPRIAYDDAVEMLKQLEAETTDAEQKQLLHMEWGTDFGSPHETAIAERFDRPVFVYHYPTAVKAFYMQPVAGRKEVCRSVDLLAPEGYGEITGGSERIYDHALLTERVKEIGINPENYRWYLDLRRYGSVPHAGFGLGVERTVAWICGLPHIRETIPYARMLHRLNP